MLVPDSAKILGPSRPAILTRMYRTAIWQSCNMQRYHQRDSTHGTVSSSTMTVDERLLYNTRPRQCPPDMIFPRKKAQQ